MIIVQMIRKRKAGIDELPDSFEFLYNLKSKTAKTN